MRRGSPRPEVTVVLQAREAQTAWARRLIGQRLEVATALRHYVAGRAEEVVEVIRAGRDGRPAEIISSELLPWLDGVWFLEKHAEALLATRKVSPAGRPPWMGIVELEVKREPYGVVLILGPSNYPFFLPGVQAMQALMAGNAVLLKPGVGGTRAARFLGESLRAAGLAEHLYTVLDEDPSTGQEAIREGVDKVVLTGSVATGRAVLAQTAEKLTPVSLELSGQDAVVVAPSADLRRVARALAFGLRLNQGKTCVAPRRVFVPRNQLETLERLLLRSLAGQAPVPLGNELRGLLDDATSQGARLILGSVGEGVVGPLILSDCPSSLAHRAEVVFAPILWIIPVTDEDEAVRLVRESHYGLGAAVFGPQEWARRIADELPVGVVTLNDLIVPTADPRLAFGGRGWSGYGLTRGPEGFLEMTVPKAILTRGPGPLYHLDDPTPSDYKLLRGYLRAAHGGGWKEKILGAAEFLRALIGERIRRRLHRAPPPGDPAGWPDE